MQDGGYRLPRIYIPRTLGESGQEQEGPGLLRAPTLRPCVLRRVPPYLTVNVQVLFWLPSMFGFWSSASFCKSCAPVVTVDL